MSFQINIPKNGRTYSLNTKKVSFLNHQIRCFPAHLCASFFQNYLQYTINFLKSKSSFTVNVLFPDIKQTFEYIQNDYFLHKYIRLEHTFATLLPMRLEEQLVHFYTSCRLPPNFAI